MHNNVELSIEQQELLQKARDTYGDKNQILVCMEELNELSCVLAKYPRYEDSKKATEELRNKIIDEVADVYIILEHVKAITCISNSEIEDRASSKLERLERWLNHSKSMEETVRDREVKNNFCTDCARYGYVNEYIYDNYCVHCHKAQATEGIAPFKLSK